MHQARHQQPTPFTTSPTSLAADGPVDLDEWLDAGQQLLAAASAVNWWVGDWLVHALDLAGDTSKASAAVFRTITERTNLDARSLEQLRLVAAQIPPEERREGLSWEHHRTVASWDRDEVRALLDEAEHGVEDERRGVRRRLTVMEIAAARRRGARVAA
jgi:hypothetical protein